MITEEMFVNEVRKVVASNPDYIYPVFKSITGTCSYLKCNNACLFGQVLSNLGVTQEELIFCETFDISKVVRDFLKDKFADISVTVRQWANAIQERQDKGDTWKVALKIGDISCPNVARLYL